MLENPEEKKRLRRTSSRPGIRSTEPEPELPIDQSVEIAVGISVEDLTSLLRLQSVRGIGPQRFKSFYEHGLRPRDLLSDPSRFAGRGKHATELRRRLDLTASRLDPVLQTRAARYIRTAHELRAKILTYGHPYYPRNVFNSNYPVPILFARGSFNVLSEQKVVACVGSRKIRPPYSDRHREFANFALDKGFVVASGFALGADAIGHRAASRSGGRTICVMPGGLERPFPPEHKNLWSELLDHDGAVFVSEAPFGVRASGLTLRKRNKLIVAFALGILVSQSAVDGGAMNAFRFAVEAHKPVATFASVAEPDTSGNELISKDSRVPVATFESGAPSREDWEQWLRRLSYSI